MLLGTSRLLTRLLRHMLETLQLGQTLLQSERRRRKLRSTYDELNRNYIFIPLACEVTDVWNVEAEEFFNDLGCSRISCSTGEARETRLLYQRPSISLQKGISACIHRLDSNFDWLDSGVMPSGSCFYQNLIFQCPQE